MLRTHASHNNYLDVGPLALDRYSHRYTRGGKEGVGKRTTYLRFSALVVRNALFAVDVSNAAADAASRSAAPELRAPCSRRGWLLSGAPCGPPSWATPRGSSRGGTSCWCWFWCCREACARAVTRWRNFRARVYSAGMRRRAAFVLVSKRRARGRAARSFF